MASAKTLRTCAKGHRYYKSSDCPVCPVCYGMTPASVEFQSVLSAPARRALENAGITSLSQLSGYRQAELLKLHGFGPSSIPKLKKLLAEKKLYFKN